MIFTESTRDKNDSRQKRRITDIDDGIARAKRENLGDRINDVWEATYRTHAKKLHIGELQFIEILECGDIDSQTP